MIEKKKTHEFTLKYRALFICLSILNRILIIEMNKKKLKRK